MAKGPQCMLCFVSFYRILLKNMYHIRLAQITSSAVLPLSENTVNKYLHPNGKDNIITFKLMTFQKVWEML